MQSSIASDKSKKLTPLMTQYFEIKAAYPDEVVLFRMGDFYEMFHKDAEIAAPIVGIALTQRNKKDEDSAKMCGVPYHSIAGPIAKLLKAGHKVAMCDQIEDPALAKGLVKRAVTRVLTPGMVYEPDTLDQLSANYLASYDDAQVAFVDVTTGEAFVYDVTSESERNDLLMLLRPVELVLLPRRTARQSTLPFTCTLSSFSGAEDCVELLSHYIGKMQGVDVVHAMANFERRHRRGAMHLSAATLRHLEVFENSRGGRDGTLFAAINRTQTSAGARLLKSWLTQPLLDQQQLELRQNEVHQWLAPSAPLKSFRQMLAQLGDVERRLGKVHSVTFNARDLMAIAQSVRVGFELTQIHPSRPQLEGLSECYQLSAEIERTLNEELPIAVKEGGLIRRGVIPELDELIDLTQNGQRLLVELETREKQLSGIASLKVRYNNVFGFYIEVTKTHVQKVPEHYRRKQTLANAERYTTDELDQLEEKILSARARRDQREFELFSRFRQKVMDLTPDLLRLSRQWTRWDVLSSFAWLSLERGYCRPQFNPDGQMTIQLSRHPVVEQSVAFVPNTVRLLPGEALLLTGPNMAGKSTLMRQVALNVMLAQIGSDVPAELAQLPLFENIFTRIGASDALVDGLSTFMVEMTETAEILKRANHKSLVIMDEIGRGTSTYDGMSLAQAILEHLLSSKKPYLLFATHYHELTSLEQLYPQLHNAHMSVSDKGGQIQFLHTLKAGPANRSYGIHVAKLAGLPGQVTQRAQTLLNGFESGTKQLSLGEGLLAQGSSPLAETGVDSALLSQIRNLNLSEMTPMQALNKLHEWQDEASS
jgi:DNA mismatch repair protein MutS